MSIYLSDSAGLCPHVNSGNVVGLSCSNSGRGSSCDKCSGDGSSVSGGGRSNAGTATTHTHTLLTTTGRRTQNHTSYGVGVVPLSTTLHNTSSPWEGTEFKLRLLLSIRVKLNLSLYFTGKCMCVYVCCYDDHTHYF